MRERTCRAFVLCVVCHAVCHSNVLGQALEAGGIVRGIYARPGQAIENRAWASYGSGYEVDTEEKHDRKASLYCANETDTEAHGAVQAIRFDQPAARPIVVAGWAKLEGVAGDPSYHCSVYLDLRLTNGQPWVMKIAAFDPRQTSWQYAEQIYVPPSPVESAKVYVFLREKAGRAWFDDIYVGEIVDEKGTRSANLLQQPGFEPDSPAVKSFRDEFFDSLKAIGCNAFHMYQSVTWERVMESDGIPMIEATDRLPDFVGDAQRHGFKVWLTVGLGFPRITDASSREFPFWPCVNNRWGEAYTRALAYFAQYGVDGIGVVPDEWTYTNGRARRAYEKCQDPEVAEFYKTMPAYCGCATCRERFAKSYGVAYPDPKDAWTTGERVWAYFTQFRYKSTAAWIQRSIQAIKQVNPNAVADTMICVLPVCSDDRLRAGAAWDMIGVETDLDCLQTDPYILLHNYLGDSTHYYATETTLHLVSANWKRRCGVTLEACRLLDKYRKRDPAEVYGAALSCLAHGAREFFWWHMNYLTGRSSFVDGTVPTRRVSACYEVMKVMETSLGNARLMGDVLVLYSRASEDTWDWLARAKSHPSLLGKDPDRRRGFLAHKHVLYYLLRRGFPFRMTFLDNPDPHRLEESRVILVPFPFALRESEVEVLEDQARSGKTVVVMSELSPLDETGQKLPTPSLLRLFENREINTKDKGPVEASLGKGRIVFIGGDFAIRLFEPMEPVKDPQTRVPLAPFDGGRAALLDEIIAAGLGYPGSLFLTQPEQDVEVTLLKGSRNYLLLAINWDTAKEAQIALRLPPSCAVSRADGYGISRDAVVRRLDMPVPEDGWALRLAAQEALLVRLAEK